MSEIEQQIRDDLSRGPICLVKDEDNKFCLQIKTSDFSYSIIDIYSEKSTAPQFMYNQDSIERRPMISLEFILFMEKLAHELRTGNDAALRIFKIEHEMERFRKHYYQTSGSHHICMRDFRDFSKTHNWTMEMYKNNVWYVARIGNAEEQDIFDVDKRPMSGVEFLELFNLAHKTFTSKQCDFFQADLFEKRFIQAGCRRIAKFKRPGQNGFDRGARL